MEVVVEDEAPTVAEESSSSSSASSSSSDGGGGKQQSVVNYLPCAVKFDGPTEVNSYFQVKSEKDGTFTSHFRGRELKGAQLELPASVNGLNIVMGGGGGGGTSASANTWEVSGSFKSFTVWQHDVAPDCAVINDYLDFMEVSRAIHGDNDA